MGTGITRPINDISVKSYTQFVFVIFLEEKENFKIKHY